MSALTGLESLRTELDAMRETVKAFGDPIISEHPGLRLMRETLTEREQHIVDQIEKVERCTLTVSLSGVPSEGLAVTLLVPLLEALQAAAIAVARRLSDTWPAVAAVHADEAVALQVTGLQEGPSVKLQRPAGPLAAQLADPSNGVPLVEQTLDRVLAVLSGDEESGPDTDEALRQLVAVVAAQPLQLDLSLTGALIQPRSVSVTRTDALRLHAALEG